MNDSLRWGILGTGAIAKTFARGVASSRTGKLVAVGSRSQESADKFGDEFHVSHRHGSYEALLADPDVQAVYISTPHPMHAQWAIKAAEAKKHVLCEKPLGVNFAEAMAIVEAARANDVFLMEAFMYRCHPQIQKLVELIRSKAIGDVRVIQATFSFHWPKPFNPDSRLTRNDLAGGGILDVGCYCASAVRLIAGAAIGKDFAEPIELKAVGHLETTGVDGYAIAVAKFPNEIVAQLSTGVQVNQDNVLRVFGADGNIVVPTPWVPSQDAKIILQPAGQDPQVIEIHADRPLYALEADVVADNLAARQAPSPAMSWADTLGNIRLLDQWRQAIGLTYEMEKLESLTHTAARRPLAVGSKNSMKYGRIPGLDLPASRLCCGADFSSGQPREAMVIFDDYFERGGNVFDTAHIYGNADRTLGHWVKSRGVRDKVIILGKGAHTPSCNPAGVVQQLAESLERLGTDHIDLYMMHRDNPEIPAGEFIAVLNEQKKLGRIRAFGGSNWSPKRVQAANEYAMANGLSGFAAMSNNFSLARMVDAPWGGCLASSDPESRAWLTNTQTILVPWSSQARGFFTDRSGPEKRDDAELVRCWYSEDNFRRKARAEELAHQRGVEPIIVALAYVLCQPFPTFPLIGPRQISETVSSFRALELELSPHELKWLNLEE